MSRDLIFLALALFSWGVGESMFFIFQPLYLEQMGASPIGIGTILGAMGIAMAVAHIPAGHLADRIGRRPLIRAAWLIGMVACWLMALARSLPILIVGMLFYNLTAFVSSPMSSYITTARGRLSIARALTFISSFYNAGAIIGPWVGGQIAGQFGLRNIYLTSASIFILSTCFILLLKRQPIDQFDHTEQTIPGRFDRKLILFLGIMFFAMFAMYLPQPLTPNYLQTVRGLDFAQIGQLGSIAGLGLVIMNVSLGSLKPRLGLFIGQLAVLVFSVLLWQDHPYIVFCLAYFLMGGFRVARLFITAMVRGLVHQSRMGLVFGITETVAGITVILSPPLAGWLYSINPSSIYITSSILISLTILASWYFLPKVLSPLPPTSPGNPTET